MNISKQNMKPFFCIDITSDKKNEASNGSEFITRTASKQKVEEFENKQEELEQTIKKSQLPLWIRIVKYILGVFFLINSIACIRAGLSTALKNAPILVIVGAVCGILWVILQIISKVKEKKVLENENAEQQSEEIDRDFKLIHKELDVPENAAEIDVLIFKYKLKNGEIRPHTSGFQTTAYVNLTVKIYETLNELHIADLENVYSFDKSELRAISTVNKRIAVPLWNKEEEPTKGIYKPYKMTVNNVGDVFLKPYHILEIERNNQLFGLYFPCYELETVEKLTGLRESV